MNNDYFKENFLLKYLKKLSYNVQIISKQYEWNKWYEAKKIVYLSENENQFLCRHCIKAELKKRDTLSMTEKELFLNH
jgi:predicted adenine nucleotide alpha hydrolase (AANH) superfamily ATPase